MHFLVHEFTVNVRAAEGRIGDLNVFIFQRGFGMK